MTKRILSIALSLISVLSLFSCLSGMNVFAADTFTIKYDADDTNATGSMKDQNIPYGTKTKTRENKFAVKNKVFLAWNLKKINDSKKTLYKYQKVDTGETQWKEKGKQDSGYELITYKNGIEVSTTAKAGNTVYFVAVWGPTTGDNAVDKNKAGHEYTVKYDANGGTGDAMRSNKYIYGITKPLTTRTFTKSGHTFVGWELSRKGGSLVNQQYAYQVSDDSSREWHTPGYQGLGYYLERLKEKDDGSAPSVKKLSSIDGGTVTLKAIWQPKKNKEDSNSYFNIDYYGNGGKGPVMKRSHMLKTIRTNAKKISPNTFVKPGYKFKGWRAHRKSDNKWRMKNTSDGKSAWLVIKKNKQKTIDNYFIYKDCCGVYSTSSENEDLVEFYAVWEKNPDTTITYKCNESDGGVGEDVTQTDAQGAIVTINENKYTNPDSSLKFIEWNTEADGSGESYEEGQEISMPKSGLTLYAIWAERAYNRVIFHKNYDGDSKDSTKDYFKTYYPNDATKYHCRLEADGTIKRFEEIPEMDCYLFKGWYDAPQGGSPIKWGETAFSLESSNQHVYAQWIDLNEEISDEHMLPPEDEDDNTGDDETPSQAKAGVYSVGAEGASQNSDDEYVEDTNVFDDTNFDLPGVQIRAALSDNNFPNGTESDPSYSTRGLRFVANIKEKLIDAAAVLYGKDKSSVSYGFVIGPSDILDERLGEDELMDAENSMIVDCTSRQKGTTGKVEYDHINEDDYRVYTLVITYDEKIPEMSKEDMLNTQFAARAYIKYTDANGVDRYYYNNYTGTDFHGGCSVSYNQALGICYPELYPEYAPAETENDDTDEEATVVEED